MFAQKLDVIPLVLLLTSVALNIWLARRVLELSANAQHQPPPLAASIVGERILAMDALTLDGQPEHISFVDGSESARPKVLYIYSPTCGWCAKNLENIKS